MLESMHTGVTCSWSRLLIAAHFLWICRTCDAGEFPIPSQQLNDLGSPEFRIRECAEMQLLDWGRKNPDRATLELFRQSQLSVDPEVRERCLSVLRGLVMDEYDREGEGYIGVALAMKDDVVIIPGEEKPRNAVRVVEVKADTPGQRSGILLNDLIVALDGEIWREVHATSVFRENIRRMKPTTVTRLTVMRDGELVDLRVTLGRRPIMADMFLNGHNANPDATERAAKEAYFQRWLSNRKTLK